ncbi:hypothetical protein D3C75_623550 [compost metagenome]
MIYTLSFARSAIPPDTIAKETAAKAIWNKNLTFKVTSENASDSKEAAVESPPYKKPVVPKKPLPLPKPSPKPIAQKQRLAIARVSTVLPATCPAFFIRTEPASSIANPACIKNTKMNARKVNAVSNPTCKSTFVGPSAAKALTG